MGFLEDDLDRGLARMTELTFETLLSSARGRIAQGKANWKEDVRRINREFMRPLSDSIVDAVIDEASRTSRFRGRNLESSRLALAPQLTAPFDTNARYLSIEVEPTKFLGEALSTLLATVPENYRVLAVLPEGEHHYPIIVCERID